MTEHHVIEAPAQVVLDPDDIAARPLELLETGVHYRLLWRRDRSAAGMMVLDPGAELAEHTHEAAIHHVWVLVGSARVEGRVLPAGSYWHVPAGTPHSLQALEEGCTIFYLFLRQPAP